MMIGAWHTWIVAFGIAAVCFVAALINWRFTRRNWRDLLNEQRMLRTGITTLLVIAGIVGAMIYVAAVEKPRGVPTQKGSAPVSTN